MVGAEKQLSEVVGLVEALLATPQMSSLWEVKDAGMPVFVHTVDVVLLAIEWLPDWQTRYGSLHASAVVIGSLLHDLTKATCRAHRRYTHSWLMDNEPELAVEEAMDALDAAQLAAGVPVDHQTADHVAHIVASHHGNWGKVQPATPEAALVHRCDLYSAPHHRVAPVDANDILPLLAAGLAKTAIARHLGVSSSVVRSRLVEASAAEGVGSDGELRALWAARGRVQASSPDRAAQFKRAKRLIEEAKKVPQSVIAALKTLEGVEW